MRIPITQADWPDSFNALAKYIGRHWPNGKLKLSYARETTARLLGYNSVHDVHQELESEISDREFSMLSMAASMAVKAVLMFNLHPIKSYQFFSSLPWTNLSVWQFTNEYKTQQLESNGVILFKDEFEDWMKYTTPALLANAFMKGQIPPYEFTISADGVMFHRAVFEQLLLKLEPDENTLKECEASLSVEEYFNSHILPLAYCPAEEMIRWLYPEQPEYWTTPEDVEVLKTVNGSYVLFHKALNAFYPGVYNQENLCDVIKKLFMLQVIPDVVTEFSISDVRYIREKINIVPCCANGSFTLKDQVFYYRNQLQDYSEFSSDSFCSYVYEHLTPGRKLALPGSAVSPAQLDAINKALTISAQLMDSHPDGAKALSEIGISDIFSNVYMKDYVGDEELEDDDSFNLRDCYFENEDERIKAEKNVVAYAIYCDRLGNDVLACMPELKPYLSMRVAGHYYHVWCDGFYQDTEDLASELNGKAEREGDFFIYLLTDRLCKEFNVTAKGIASRAVNWSLMAMRDKCISVDMLKTSFSKLIQLCSSIQKDERILTAMERYSATIIKSDDKYVNHGAAYTPKFKTDTGRDLFSQAHLLRRQRKFQVDVLLSTPPLVRRN